MRSFLSVLSAEFRSPVPWVLWLTVSTAVAITGPFGSYGAFGLFERALFWTPLVGMSIAIGSTIRAFVYGPMGLAHGTLGTFVIAALNCLVLCPILFAVFHIALPPVYSDAGHVLEIALLVGSISLGVCALRQVQPEVVPPAALPQTDVAEPPRLLRRLDPAFHGQIMAMTVRDHYVDVQTDKGKTSLLMRFSDAIDEVAPVSGAQVHRSHWVAWDAVASIFREGGKVVLHLKNAQPIPVSRNNRDKVDARFPPPPPIKDVAA